QQDISPGAGQQPGRRSRIGGGQSVLGQGAGGAEQPETGHSGLFTGRPDVGAGLGGVGVGGVHAEGRPCHQSRHAGGVQPAGVNRDARGFPLLDLAVFGGHADGDRDSFRRQLMGEGPPLGGAAEYGNPGHFRYPRGVMRRPFWTRVWEEPTKTVVHISSSARRSSYRVSRRAVWPPRAMFRTQPQAVSGLKPASSRISQARRRVSFRRWEAGLYRQRTKSPAAAARSRFSTISQGVSRSDRDTVQK